MQSINRQAPLPDKAAHVEGILAVDSWSQWWCVAAMCLFLLIRWLVVNLVLLCIFLNLMRTRSVCCTAALPHSHHHTSTIIYRALPKCLDADATAVASPVCHLMGLEHHHHAKVINK